MTPLARARRRIETRILEFEARLDAGDPNAWPDYLATVQTLVSVIAAEAPGAGGRLLTTAELADAMKVCPKTILRRRKAGLLEPARQLGKRGRAALRWAAPSS